MLELGGVFGKEIKKAVERVSMLLYPPLHTIPPHMWA